LWRSGRADNVQAITTSTAPFDAGARTLLCGAAPHYMWTYWS